MKIRERIHAFNRKLTIKKRLSISNTIMFLVPVFVTFFTLIIMLGAAFYAFVNLYLPRIDGITRKFHEMGEQYITRFETFFKLCGGLFVIMLIIIIISIILTNHFLTKFVIKKINEPLKIISDGVERVQEGNLESPIVYNREDEFTPVCQTVNMMTEKLKESAERSQADEQSRRELFAGISHDLRSPLTSVRAYTEALLDGVAKTPEDEYKYLTKIHKHELEIERMVEQLFLFSKMELNNFPVTLQSLNLRTEILRILNDNPMDKLLVNIDKVENVSFCCDAALFSRIMLNLLENSLKYSNKEQTLVMITAEHCGKKIQLVLTDNGPGVNNEMLPKLFDAFYRTDPARKNPAGGSGLGLAIVKKAVDRMNGSINAENSPGGGLLIRIFLPGVDYE